MLIVVLSDTHVPDFAKRLPEALRPELERADVILHAGDVNSAALLEELAAYAPVHVALGNNDHPDVAEWGAAEEVRIELDGVPIAMLHDSGPREGRERRLLKRFPGTRLIVFGHSHIPLDHEHAGVRFLNPGSCTWKRRQPEATYGRIEIHRGEIRSEVVPLRP